ncbi:hypothetical protein GMORB2_1813 [Geosmithia morbida]|uniref:Coiled-coil domain-containing protein 16 n=1 Tax=Geosmithia morbida TaxID=1094350 RepID=A0A9P4YTJ8_9HYPO|nr:uncharacterized protein GMORB2_1813 [Geosmithia morbida]KAF4121406.1 hypothetical protein GMORB2_1813 [Geosmithia morbida]
MSDARSLLRQQRAARRVTHPNAAYSDTGKLLCTLCREPIKSESLWESHISSEAHKKRQVASAAVRPSPNLTTAAAPAAVPSTVNKRKHEEDQEMADRNDSYGRGDEDGDSQTDQDHKRKRIRPEGSSQTPPSAAARRRLSQTPSQGIELQIPSRPATPRDSSASSSTTTAIPSRTTDNKTQSAIADVTAPPINGAAAISVDEDEWAAFEAEIAAADTTNNNYDEATISGAAITAEELARQKEAGDQGGEGHQRPSKPDTELQDEREDAKRALEDEMDEMRDLEAKVLRLKEKRDALRQRATSHSHEVGGEETKAAAAAVAKGQKEPNGKGNSVAVVAEGDDDESDESDEDDWDGFRFRAAAAR